MQAGSRSLPPDASATLMHAEGQEAGTAVQRMLAANGDTFQRIASRLRSRPPTSVFTLARGSSDNAATYGRYLMEIATGTVCASVGLSVGSIYRAQFHAPDSLCIAISQSGASPDLLAAVERAKAGGAWVVGMINQPGSPLAPLCDEVIALSAGPERSVAATKSFVCSLAAFAMLTARWTADAALVQAIHGLPKQLDEAWDLDWAGLVAALHHATSLYVLGRGPGLGIAQEAALKLKETCGLHAEAFSSAEVAHGPMALIKPGFPVITLAQSDASLETTRVAVMGVAERGANVLIAGAAAERMVQLPSLAGHPLLEPLLLIQPFYRATCALSLARGFDPDHPPHLAKVTRTL